MRKIGILLAAVLILTPVTAHAKTTIDIDYINDKVTVAQGSKVKVGKYKVKTVYTVGRTRLYREPGNKNKVSYTVKKGTYLTRIMKGKKYSIVCYGTKKQRYFFVKNKQVTTKKPTATKAKYSASYFRKMGVIHWNGWRWTWYSQRVLPGGGLKIPGRHVDEHGYICDKDNYICVASSKLKKHTVIDTPFGKKGKVYDSGCAKNTIDVYCDVLHD